MNTEKIIKKLKTKYPKKNIVQNKDEKGEITEIVCEIEPTADHSDWSKAIVVLNKSMPHKHKITTEEYIVKKGVLKLFINGEPILLKEGESYVVRAGNIHNAIGKETWFECISKPGWRVEDFIAVG